MFSQAATPPPTVPLLPSENISQETPQETSVRTADSISQKAIAIPSPPETLPAQFSTTNSPHLADNEQLGSKALAQSITAEVSTSSDAAKTPEKSLDKDNAVPNTATADSQFSKNNLPHLSDSEKIGDKVVAQRVITAPIPSQVSTISQPAKTPTDSVEKNNPVPTTDTENTIAEARNLLLGVIINNREVGSLDVVREENTLFLPLLDFAQIAGFTVETAGEKTQLKTPLGVIAIAANELRQINGITYISDSLLKEKLATNIELKTSDLALIVDLPWRRSNGQSNSGAVAIQPEVRPPSSGLSNLRQELNFYSNSGNTSWRSSTLLGGRLAGGAWRVRLENNFVDDPDITEYFFFKRSGQLLYQLGRQQIGLNPLLSGVNLTGAQVGYTNLPVDKFNNNYGANELLPRRSQPVQTFRGVVPPTSFVQLRVSGIVIAQQQVGFSGEYEFLDVNLPTGQSSEIELLVFDRNNPNVPREIRSLRLNASDLLLPSGGSVQLAGFGFSGNSIQNALFDSYNTGDAGQPVAFYQVRQGISNNLTLEGAVQVLPDTTQAQAGFAWRLADPVILATSVGTSRGEFGYTADLDIQLDRLQIIGNSELYPSGYLYDSQSRDLIKHSLETKYRFSNNFSLGFVARSYQDQSNSADYILPTFNFSPFSSLSFSGRPDILGRYLFNAFYQATPKSRLAFNSTGDIYSADFSYNFNREYLLSLGSESGGDLATRYTVTLNRNASSLSGLSWRLGLAYRDGEVGPVVGASMRLIPGLFARIDYQGIPSRYKNIVSGIGDDRLMVSLVSDLSLAGGRVAPAEYTAISKNRGAIAGRIIIEGGRKDFDLSASNIQVFNSRNQSFGGANIDSQGNFFVGNLPEGVYIVQLDPDQLPVELSLKKTSVIVEVANSAVTRLDFPLTIEYGLAGRVTDAAGKPIPELEVRLVNAEGKQISSSVTDQFGLYRLDGVPTGKYSLQVPSQEGITSSDTLPKREITIDDDFLYDQDLQLPISPAVKETKEPALNSP